MRAIVFSCLMVLTLNSGCDWGTSNKKTTSTKELSAGSTETALTVDASNILYSDSFSGMSGSKVQHVNGTMGTPTDGRTRMLFPFGAMSEDPSILEVVEDSKTLGPDGKPGVLRFTWQKVPAALQYSGFSYNGAAQPIQPPMLVNAKSRRELYDILLRFRYKGLNSNGEEPGFHVDCRIEPDAANSFGGRLELKRISPKDKWQEFSVRLGIGGNVNSFLRAMDADISSKLKIVFSQEGPISNYKSGDTLLIDDLDIVYSKRPAETEWSDPSGSAFANYNVAGHYLQIEGFSTLDHTNFVMLPTNRFAGSQGTPWPVAPHGDLSLAGVPVSIRGATFLWGGRNAEQGAKFPDVIPQIPCQQAFESLYILQGGFYSSDVGVPVFDVVLNYSDETKKSLPLLYGNDVRDWHMKGEPMERSQNGNRSLLAWVADGVGGGKPQRVCFNLTEVRNPEASKIVETIDLVSAKNDTAACILAITVGRSGKLGSLPSPPVNQ